MSRTEELQSTITKTLDILLEYGTFDGDFHKMYAIDQAVRILTGDNYDKIITEFCAGEDGADTYEWDTGIAPYI